jgi:hypothetical protein
VPARELPRQPEPSRQEPPPRSPGPSRQPEPARQSEPSRPSTVIIEMRDNLRLAPDRGMGTALLAGMAGVVLIAALIVWGPWNGFRVSHKSARMTVGSSMSRPTAPTTTSPAAPANH